MSKQSRQVAVRLHARVWVEVDGRPALTDAGADLLEQIDACGSLSAAARKLQFSYRRAWMLLDAMNRRWGAGVAKTAIGGKKGGGAELTDFGRSLLAAYRDVQLQMEFALDRQNSAFDRFLRSVTL